MVIAYRNAVTAAEEDEAFEDSRISARFSSTHLSLVETHHL
jgi:hypothetical protein